MSRTIIVQGIGLVAAALMIGSFQCKKSGKLFFFQMCSSLTYIFHFYLLGALSGSGNIACGMMRSFVYSQRKHKWAQWKGWVFVLVGANVIATLFTWKNFMSLLPLFGTAGSTVAGRNGNGKNIRLANLFVCCPCWIIYDIYSHSVPGIISESFILCSIFISVLRFGWKALDGDGEE